MPTNSNSNSNYSSSSKTYTNVSRAMSPRAMKPSVRASCYTVSASTGSLNGLHYSTTPVSSGIPSPPLSPPLAAQASARRNTIRSGPAGREGAAYTIAEQCERLFCSALRAAFLGERKHSTRASLQAMGALDYSVAGLDADSDRSHRGPRESQYFDDNYTGGYHDSAEGNPNQVRRAILDAFAVTPPSSAGSAASEEMMARHAAPAWDQHLVREWIEVFDYVGGVQFKGFTVAGAAKGHCKSLVVFFDIDVVGRDLKQGLMSLIELAATEQLGCEQLVICVDSNVGEPERTHLLRDLRWVGFEPTTLEEWAGGNVDEPTSDRWVLLGMDV